MYDPIELIREFVGEIDIVKEREKRSKERLEKMKLYL
jgi:hypothetical protein